MIAWILLGVLAILLALDWYTTAKGIPLGAREVGPFASNLIPKWGVTGYMALKTAATLLLVGGWIVLMHSTGQDEIAAAALPIIVGAVYVKVLMGNFSWLKSR